MPKLARVNTHCFSVTTFPQTVTLKWSRLIYWSAKTLKPPPWYSIGPSHKELWPFRTQAGDLWGCGVLGCGSTASQERSILDWDRSQVGMTPPCLKPGSHFPCVSLKSTKNIFIHHWILLLGLAGSRTWVNVNNLDPQSGSYGWWKNKQNVMRSWTCTYALINVNKTVQAPYCGGFGNTPVAQKLSLLSHIFTSQDQ